MEVTKLNQPGELFRDCDALPLKKKKKNHFKSQEFPAWSSNNHSLEMLLNTYLMSLRKVTQYNMYKNR